VWRSASRGYRDEAQAWGPLLELVMVLLALVVTGAAIVNAMIAGGVW
jgi:hypothetical protein